MPENFDELPKRLSEDLEARLDEFDEQWSSDTPPDVGTYLTRQLRTATIPHPSHWRRYVAELLSIDLEHRLRRSAGQSPRIEDYFAQLPWLPADPLVLSELIQVEYLHRQRSGEAFDDKEYARRFPHLVATIDRALAEARSELAREQPGSVADTEDDLAATENFGVVGEETLIQRTPARSDVAGMPDALGDYDLQHEIARGGMGIVYKAVQSSLKRPVALKVIRAGTFADKQEIHRFHAEAEAAARLDHPNIVPIFEVGQSQGHPYFSMAWIDGPALSAVVAQQPLAPGRAARLMRDVAAAIAYAHGKGVIHRDLKPSNILLEGDTTPRVTDFGLARQTNVESGYTERGQVLGAPPYMPPEQALGHVEKIDRRSDVYSLGATLYHLVTARPPFIAATVLQTLAQVVQDDPVPPRRLNDNIPRDLENICLKCLNKSPDDRYQSAEEFQQDLDRFLRGEPTLARPLSPWERMYRYCRRKPKIAALLATVVGSVLLALVAISTGLLMTRQSLKQTRIAQAKTQGALSRAEQSESRARASEAEAIDQRDLARQRLRLAEFHIYLNELQRARRLWDEGQVDLVRTALNDLPDRLSLWDDLRGWEYDWMRGLLQQEQLKFDQAHEGQISGVAWSADGRRVASAGQDPLIKVWDLEQRQLQAALRDHRGSVRALRFVDDDAALMSLSEDGTARRWRWDGRRNWLPDVVADDLAGLKYGAIAHDGRRWAWSDGRRIEVRTQDDVEPLLDKDAESGRITALAFDAQGSRLAVADSAAQTVTVHALDDETPPVTLEAGERAWFALAFSADGSRLAAGGTGGWLQVWDLPAQHRIGEWSADQGTIYSLQFADDPDQLLTGSEDGTVRLWSIRRERTLEIFRGHNRRVIVARLNPDGQQILSGGDDGTLRLWRPERNQIHLHYLAGADLVLPAAQGDGLRYVTASIDPEPAVSSQSSRSGERMLRSMSFDPNVPPTDVPLPVDGITHLLPLPDPPGSFVMAHADGMMHCDTEGTVLYSHGETPATILKLCSTPAGDRLATSDATGTIRLFGVAGSEAVWERTFEARSAALQFASDGRRLIVIDLFGTASLLDAESGETVREGALADSALCLSIAPHEPLLAVGGIDGTIRLHALEDLRELRVLRGHQQGVNDIAFSPDGGRIASAGTDGAVRIFSPEHPAPLLTLDGHEQPVTHLDWSDDGQSLVSIDREGTAIRWSGHALGSH